VARHALGLLLLGLGVVSSTGGTVATLALLTAVGDHIKIRGRFGYFRTGLLLLYGEPRME
jgi:hypothetical protein